MKYRRAHYAANPESYRELSKRNKVIHREAIAARGKRYRNENRERIRFARLLRDYGVTEEWYDVTLERQGMCCAICRSNDPGGKRNEYFVVDHDHATGRPRGLLCHRCNLALGLLGDSIESLESAINYLNRGQS